MYGKRLGRGKLATGPGGQLPEVICNNRIIGKIPEKGQQTRPLPLFKEFSPKDQNIFRRFVHF